MIIHNVRHDVRFRSNRFTYNDETHTFITEVSSVIGNLRMGQIIDDGFDIVSERTGKQVTFAMDSVDENEGDIAGWRFKAIKYPKNYKGPRDLKALIIND